MKKKLLSIVSVVLALSMTTSAFAATPRGTGDVDGHDGVTANDVLMILKGLADENPEANVNGSANGVERGDARVLLGTILQPKYVSEDLALRVYTENYSIGSVPVDIIEGAEDLGSGFGTNEYGTKVVANDGALLDGVNGNTTIKGALDTLVGTTEKESTFITDETANKITEQLAKISFKNALGNDVALRSEGGWAKLCWALKPIIPLTQRDADILNRADEVSSPDEIAAKQSRVEALENIRTIVVGDATGDAICDTPLTKSDIVAIKDNALVAFDNNITEDEVRETVARVLTITDQKYGFYATYNGIDDEAISSSAVEAGSYTGDGFVKQVCDFIGGYQDKTLAQFRAAFGDKVAISSQRTDFENANMISAVAEFVVKAEYRPGEVEDTTAAPVEPTETTTEAPTETTTEAPTETTTEAPAGADSGSVAGMPIVVAPTDLGNRQILFDAPLSGSEVHVKTVLNFDYAAKAGALLTVSYNNNGNGSDSTAKLRMDGSGNIAIDAVRDVSLGTLTPNEDHTIEFIINTVDGTFKVAVDGGTPVENAGYVDERFANGIAGVKISQGNGTDAQRTTTVKEISWTGNEAGGSAPVEPTETTTEAPTETTTEAPTETTTEAPAGADSGSVAGMPIVVAPTDDGNRQILFDAPVTGNIVRVKTVLNFDAAAKTGALLTVSYNNNGNGSDSSAKLRMDTTGAICIDAVRDVPLGTLTPNEDHTIEFIINTADGTFQVSVDGGAPVSNAGYVDARFANGVAGVKISQGNGTDAQRTTTVKEVSWTVE